MAALPVNSEGDSATDTIMQSPSLKASAPQSQNPSRVEPPGLIRTKSELPRRRRGVSPEKQQVENFHPPPQQQVSTLSPPIGQFLINTLLQIAAFTAAIAFGVYAVKSVTVGSDANRQAGRAVELAVTANQLAILAVCLSSGNQVGHAEPPFRFREN
jgi:hypothetical protein